MTMKKGAVCSAALLALVGTSALAAPNLTNVNQKGSLLIFPLIEAVYDQQNQRYVRDTIVFISNDNTYPVTVKCYYGEYTGVVDLSLDGFIPGDNDFFEKQRLRQIKPTRDFMFEVTKTHPVMWRASDGAPLGGDLSPTAPDFPQKATGTGQLICFAVTKGGENQVVFNHLSGMAKVVQPQYLEPGIDGFVDGQSWEYSAYGFYCRSSGATRGRNFENCGESGSMQLDGKFYDKCGKYLIGQIIPEGTPGLYGDNRNFLSVSNCTQDLSNAGYAIANYHEVEIDVWNGEEQKQTTATDLIDGWWRIRLSDASSAEFYDRVDNLGDNLTYNILETATAQYRLQSTEGYGLVGVQVQYHNAVGYSATTVHHADEVAGKIDFYPQPDEVPERR